MKNKAKNHERKEVKEIKAIKELKIIPQGSRVLVLPEEREIKEKTDSGIYIPETSGNEKPEQGEVLAVGDGSYDDGDLIPVRVKVGDKIIFSKYGYDEIKHNGKKYFIIKEENILAVIK